MTPAVRRALGAVVLGEVERVYRANGNVLRGPKGVASTTLWRIARLGWIDDAKGSAGTHMEVKCKQVLTKAGREALAAAN